MRRCVTLTKLITSTSTSAIMGGTSLERPEIPTTAILALALAACTGEVDKMSYSVGATDQSGGESVRVTLS